MGRSVGSDVEFQPGVVKVFNCCFNIFFCFEWNF
jgi:hypothetical protein